MTFIKVVDYITNNRFEFMVSANDIYEIKEMWDNELMIDDILDLKELNISPEAKCSELTIMDWQTLIYGIFDSYVSLIDDEDIAILFAFFVRAYIYKLFLQTDNDIGTLELIRPKEDLVLFNLNIGIAFTLDEKNSSGHTCEREVEVAGDSERDKNPLLSVVVDNSKE